MSRKTPPVNNDNDVEMTAADGVSTEAGTSRVCIIVSYVEYCFLRNLAAALASGVEYEKSLRFAGRFEVSCEWHDNYGTSAAYEGYLTSHRLRLVDSHTTMV